MKLTPIASVAAIWVAGAFGLATPADAQAPAAPAAPAPAPAAAPSTAISLPYGISMTGHVEVGTSINPDSPDNNTNFGQTFTDRDNTFRMNQLMLNVERDLDPKNADWQWGFKFTGMYGTDSRVTHFLGEFDRVTKSPYQWDIVELDGQAHIPIPIGGGTDLKLGQYPTPLGAEVIDATGNTFYSHSYIFNYGLPFKHTGLLTTTHVTDMIDVWLGLDTGSNNSIFDKGMANNYFPKILTGIGLNGLMDGNLTVLALLHAGPENPRFTEFAATCFPNCDPATQQGGPFTSNFLTAPPAGQGSFGGQFNHSASSAMREYFDVVTTYKINDAWTTVNEINVIHDDLGKATGGGMSQYVTYALNDQWTLGARMEGFEDQGKATSTAGTAAHPGIFFPGFACVGTTNLSYTDAQRGLVPALGYCSNAADFNALIGELTVGATYKPPLSLPVNVMIRPEARFDTIVGGSRGLKPFDVTNKGQFSAPAGSPLNPTSAGTKTSQVTLSVDLIIGF